MENTNGKASNMDESRIKVLTYAKDNIEKALAVLEKEGYNTGSNPVFNDLHRGCKGLRYDIMGMQSGSFPIVEEVA